MHIVNEKDLNVLWGWDEQEEKGLSARYEENIERLMGVMKTRLAQGQIPPPEDLKALALELQSAGDSLSQYAENCFEAARFVYAIADKDPENREKRQQTFAALQDQIGGNVVLKQSSVPQIAGKHLTLEDIQGIKGILSDGENLWEALIDFLVPVDSEAEGT